MSDWKSTLKALKKEMFGAKSEGGQSKKAPTIGASFAERKSKKKLQHVARSPSSEVGMKEILDKFQDSTQPPEKSRRRTQQAVPPKTSAPNGIRSVAIRTAHKIQIPQVPPPPPKPTGVPDRFNLQAPKILTRQAYFKLPEAWISEGDRTQLSTTETQAGGAIDIFIGLDFGTSYTKAAIGLKDQIFVVDWHGVSACADRYLLPSEYSLMADGSCQIGQAPDVPVNQVLQHLKHPLIDAAVSTASLADAAVFLALVLRYIRAWVFYCHGDKIGRSPIRWMLNIGAPSNGLESERHRRAYLKMTSSAWSMSTLEPGPNAAQACDLISSWQPDVLPRDLIGLDVLPEFVAQIAGYVQSAQRQRGLHALVDVGGGTLDVVTFIVHERDGEDVFPFLVPEIRALGTQMLNMNRLVEAPEHEKSKLPDELHPVLNAFQYAQCSGLPEDHVALRDKVFWGEVRSTVHRVFLKTKRNRYRLSEAWTKGLPVFLTGGGGSVEGYRRSVQTGGQQCAPVMNLMPLPKHPKLAEFGGSTVDYQRVSVACGLAQDSYSLGLLIPAGEVEDDDSKAFHTAERLDRDELYAR